MSDTPPIVRIAAKSADFGDIEITDDTEEMSISFGRLTHQHVGAVHCDLKADNVVFDAAQTFKEVFLIDVGGHLKFGENHKQCRSGTIGADDCQPIPAAHAGYDRRTTGPGAYPGS